MLSGTYGAVSWELSALCSVLGCRGSTSLAFWNYSVVGVM